MGLFVYLLALVSGVDCTLLKNLDVYVFWMEACLSVGVCIGVVFVIDTTWCYICYLWLVNSFVRCFVGCCLIGFAWCLRVGGNLG